MQQDTFIVKLQTYSRGRKNKFKSNPLLAGKAKRILIRPDIKLLEQAKPNIVNESSTYRPKTKPGTCLTYLRNTIKKIIRHGWMVKDLKTILVCSQITCCITYIIPQFEFPFPLW